jgi:transmembrane sensor
MNGNDTGPGASRAAEEAASWFVRLRGDATGDDWLAFEGWLRSSPAHADAYAKVERLWVELELLGPQVEQTLEPRPRRGARPRSPISRRLWMAGAGSALAAGLATLFVSTRQAPAPSTTYRTAPGEERQIILSDGTRVHLNAQSQMTVRMDSDARRIELSDAEAVFDVAHDPARPFLITVGDQLIRVVGTEFNLRRRGAKTALTVRRGVVEVRPRNGPGATPIRVSVGQQLTHVDGEKTLAVERADPARAFGWTTGQLVYRNEPLSEVAADLSRRFGVTIRPADRATGALRFTGVLVTDNEAAVLRRLEAFAAVKAERVSSRTVVLRRRSGG